MITKIILIIWLVGWAATCAVFGYVDMDYTIYILWYAIIAASCGIGYLARAHV